MSNSVSVKPTSTKRKKKAEQMMKAKVLMRELRPGFLLNSVRTLRNALDRISGAYSDKASYSRVKDVK